MENSLSIKEKRPWQREPVWGWESHALSFLGNRGRSRPSCPSVAAPLGGLSFGLTFPDLTQSWFAQRRGLFSFMDKEFERLGLLLPLPNRSLARGGEASRRRVLRARGEGSAPWMPSFSSNRRAEPYFTILSSTRGCAHTLIKPSVSAVFRASSNTDFSFFFFPPAAVFWT